MRPRQKSPEDTESGFVIVGVVMFVLALTILGLSLFSLSSFEAQFMARSMHEARALHNAIGGLERVKHALAGVDSLQAAKLCEDDGLIYANARPVLGPATYGDSIGPVPWSGNTVVELRCTGASGGVERTVVAQYDPNRGGEIYENLIVSSTGVTVTQYHPAHGYDAAANTYLRGSIWQTSGDISYAGIVAEITEPPTVSPAPTPNAASYLSDPAWTPSVPPVDFSNLDQPKIILNAAGSDYMHFWAPPGFPGVDGYAWYNNKDTDIEISGTAVLMFSGGAYSNGNVRVIATPGPPRDRLIIVATQDAAGRGLEFHGGMHSPDVSVILVSDGRVSLRHVDDFPNPGAFLWLSVFANGVRLLAPDGIENPPGSGKFPLMLLNHTAPYSPPDDVILDDLISWGILPGLSGAASTDFVLIPGTWREIAWAGAP